MYNKYIFQTVHSDENLSHSRKKEVKKFKFMTFILYILMKIFHKGKKKEA